MLQERIEQGVALLTMDNPPVNGLSHGLRSALWQAVERLEGDAAVQAIVITGSAKAFSGGADIREFGQASALAEPNLPQLTQRLEACSKPLVAAVNRLALGGGLELALSCHYRVAAQDAQLGLPEVAIGLLPGAGGTQRLPRAVGLATALQMITSGIPMKAAKLATLPGQRLIDLCVPSAESAAHGHGVRAQGAGLPQAVRAWGGARASASGGRPRQGGCPGLSRAFGLCGSRCGEHGPALPGRGSGRARRLQALDGHA